MPKITPFLWFDSNAFDALAYYSEVFEDSELHTPAPEGDGPPPMVVTARIAGQEVVALNGGPHNQLNEAFSFSIDCVDQAEVDFFWEKLTADGGEPGPCGWLKDRFGLSWQVVPRALITLMSDPDREKADRVTKAMLKMSKIVVADLQRAYDGEAA